MKGLDLFCASQAATSICSSLDHRSMVRHGHRPIDRQRSNKSYVPCSSQLPLIPGIPYHQKSRKSSVKPSDVRRKSSADIHDLIISPPGSSRYLLSDTQLSDWLSDSDYISPAVPPHHRKPHHVSFDDSTALKSSPSARSRREVVVMRVSIHCKGCEGKIRKHISRMEGVTSFSIDLATKKVTVIGDVTPSSVVASVSRVKNAQLWPSAATVTSSSPMVKTPLLIRK